MNILVADDDETMRLSIKPPLAAWGHTVVTAKDGTQAWNILSQPDSPELVLLDWKMPGKDGMELCRMIRTTANMHGKYAILMSTQHEQADMMEGLEAGANDFMGKPWGHNELKCRIHVGERVLAYQNEIGEKSRLLAEYANQMSQLAADRAKQLIHADRMSTLGLWSAQTAHEIINPLTCISGNSELIQDFWTTVVPLLAQDHTLDPHKREFILREFPRSINDIHDDVLRIQNLLNGLKRFAREDADKQSLCDVHQLIQNALKFCSSLLKLRILVELDIPENLPSIFANQQQIEQVFINLMTNSADSQVSQGRVSVVIRAKAGGRQIELTVDDNGPGFSADALKHLWEPFFTTKNPEHGTGLGLSIIKEIITRHGGTISAGNRPEGGARISIRLPAS